MHTRNIGSHSKKLVIFTVLVLVFITTTSAATVDDFEDGDIAEWTASDGGANWAADTSAAYSGSYGLYFEDYCCGDSLSSQSGLSNYPQRGDNFEFYIQTTDDGSSSYASQTRIRFFTSGNDFYGIRFDLRSSNTKFRKVVDGTSTQLGSSSFDIGQSANEWHRVEVTTGSSSTDVTIYDSSDAQVASFSTSDSSLSSGGIEINIVGDYGAETWYLDEWQITSSANSAPNAPSNPSPSDGATGVSTSPTVSASYSDPDGDSGTLHFYTGGGSSIGSCSVSDGGSCGVTYSGASSTGTTYDWYAVADDGSATTQSSTWSFTTNYAPDAPSNPSPSDGAKGVSTSPTISASYSDPDGDSGTLHFYTGGGSSIGSCSTSSGSSCGVTYSSASSTGTTYDWYAVADDGSATTQSSTWSFTTTYLATQSNTAAPLGALWIEGTSLHWADGSTEYFFDPVLSNDSAVATYHMDSGSGQTVKDFSGSGNSGVLGDSTSSDDSDPGWTTGKFRSGLTFAGNTESTGSSERLPYMDTSNNLKLLSKDGTVTDLGVQASQVGGAGDFDGDGDADVAYRSTDGYVMTVDLSGNTYNTSKSTGDIGGMGDFDGDSDQDIAYGSGSDVMTVDSAGNTANPASDLEYDLASMGDLDGDGDQDIAYTDSSDVMYIVDSAGNKNSIGEQTSYGGTGGIGDIDGDGDNDVAWSADPDLYATDYSGNRISLASNMERGGGTVGGMMDYDADSDLEVAYVNEQSELSWVDSSGSKSSTGNSASQVGYVGSGFPSTSSTTHDYIAIENLNYNSAGSISELTVCGWVKSSSSQNQMIASFDRSEYWRLALNDDTDSSNRVAWDTHDSTGATNNFYTSSSYTDGSWHHICGWFKAGASPDKKIFVDGSMVASTTAHGGNSLGSGVTRYGFIGIGSEAGSFDGSKGPNVGMEGKVDEVRLYHRALSNSEIKRLYGGVGSDVGAPPGSAWIEGSAVHWIDQNGFERAYKAGDTGNNPSGALTGSTWMENGMLHYIDVSGNERRTS